MRIRPCTANGGKMCERQRSHRLARSGGTRGGAGTCKRLTTSSRSRPHHTKHSPSCRSTAAPAQSHRAAAAVAAPGPGGHRRLGRRRRRAASWAPACGCLACLRIDRELQEGRAVGSGLAGSHRTCNRVGMDANGLQHAPQTAAGSDRFTIVRQKAELTGQTKSPPGEVA